MPAKIIAVLDSMWDWRAMTSGAGYREAPRHFRINPDNFSGARLYRIAGKDTDLLVTNSCRELCGSASQHGTPDSAWLAENLRLLEPFDVLLVCGKVAQATYRDSGYAPQARVLEMPHPAARMWTHAMLNDAGREGARSNEGASMTTETLRTRAEQLKATECVHKAAWHALVDDLLAALDFQGRAAPWMQACFGPAISNDRQERNHRFLEESLELIQACGATASEAHQEVEALAATGCYRALQLNRLPKWADLNAIGAVYRRAREMTLETGVPHHVDHEVPLQGQLVSGLHVHNNLSPIPARENWSKRNRYDVG